MDIPGSWNFTMLAVHFCTLIVILWLLWNAPDWTQRVVMFSLLLGFGFYTADSAVHLFMQKELDYESPLLRIAIAFEHVAVILGVWRIWLLEHGKSCKNSLEPFRSSDHSSKSSA